MIYFYVVDHEREDKFVAVGDSVTIPCYGSILLGITWQYKNPTEMNARDIYDSGRHSAYADEYYIDALTYDLTIHNVEVADAGEYWCAEDEGFGVKHVTKLFVTGIILLLLYV